MHANPIREAERVSPSVWEFGGKMNGPMGLCPACVIQYHRHRFVDGYSGARVALDEDIQCTGMNPMLLPGYRPRRPHVAVLEIKGTMSHCVPPVLSRMPSIVWQRRAFSKYRTCLITDDLREALPHD
jgi:hypothetical protein